ncbi:MAG: protein kinase [archaeon]|nr:protein kinase [archaeon]
MALDRKTLINLRRRAKEKRAAREAEEIQTPGILRPETESAGLEQELEQIKSELEKLKFENERLQSATFNPDNCDFVDAKSYQYVKKLGQGGQGQVWHAKKRTHWVQGRHLLPSGESDVALKFMTSYSGEASGIVNMINEGKIMSLFDHENLMNCEPLMMKNYKDLPREVQNVLEDEARQRGQDINMLSIPLIEMKYVRGFGGLKADLRSWLDALRNWASPYSNEKPRMHVLTAQLGAFIASRVARGAEEAHTEFNLSNKDIKPANILITRKGTVKLTDFTMTKMVAKEGTALGTTEYMSPEQMMSLDISSATDVYSLSLVLYRLLRGALPWRLNEDPRIEGGIINDEKDLLPQICARARLGFRDGRKDEEENKINYIQDPAYSLREIDSAREGIRLKICDAIRKGLNPNPEERPSAGDFAKMLEGAIYSLGYGPTNNSLRVAGRLLSRNPLVIDYVTNPSNGELKEYNAQYEEAPASLRTVTKNDLSDLAFSCKDPKATRVWLDSFRQGEKRPLPMEHIPFIAKSYLTKEDIKETKEVTRETEETAAAIKYEQNGGKS